MLAETEFETNNYISVSKQLLNVLLTWQSILLETDLEMDNDQR